ncbi:alpha/beta fold hydrolase [Nocardia sp. NPDC058176]|uniref:alpha/beta fold hydrolase n=1 Tax=Nocardia sp. NPDC058176 TaxID=3346368 RepID=UPI0036DD28B1
MTLRRTIIGSLCAIMIALPAAVLTVPAAADPVPAFYDQPAPLPPGAPGDVIRTEPAPLTLSVPIPTGTLPGTATRIMFHTSDTHGSQAVSTGLVLKPAAAWQGPGPQPLVAYLNGVHGQGRHCAPSLHIPGSIRYSPPLGVMAEYELPFLYALLAQGYVVVVPDYPGLGTEGTPSALNPIAEARTALDAVRAAQRLGDPAIPAGGPVVFTGYSQGGNAAGGVAEELTGYAPELDVLGIIAGSVPTDLRVVLARAEGEALIAVAGYVLNTVSAYSPEAAQAVDQLLSPAGRALMNDAAGQCATEAILRYGFQHSTAWTADGRPLWQNLDENPVTRDVADRLSLGHRAPRVPILLITGDNDDVPAEPVADLADRWCARGTTVALHRTGIPAIAPGAIVGHSLNLLAAFPGVMLGWIHDRFAGAPAPSTCG